MTQEKIEHPTRKLKVILDIDGVLTSRHDLGRQQTELQKDATLYLEHHGMKIYTGRSDTPYYIFPGVIELIQFLASRDDVEFGFFSAGSERRNKQFVEQLLFAALKDAGIKRPGYVPRICSNTDLEHEKHIDGSLIPRKNLHKIVPPDDLKQLGHTLLVDDQYQNAAIAQRGNLLRSPKVIWSEFSLLQNKIHSDNKMGWRYSFVKHVNHIFYITGILAECIANSQMQLAIETLHPLNFDEKGAYDFQASTMSQKHWYDKGLICLKEFNPNLAFNTHTRFVETLNKIKQVDPIPSCSLMTPSERERPMVRRQDSPRPTCSQDTISHDASAQPSSMRAFRLFVPAPPKPKKHKRLSLPHGTPPLPEDAPIIRLDAAARP